ncbi:MAG: hypothetical protein OXQ89_09710 [Rhodospirillaceae bacterium]|nr:hypothetical protein [Rhodospirillaceae bacterium]
MSTPDIHRWSNVVHVRHSDKAGERTVARDLIDNVPNRVEVTRRL